MRRSSLARLSFAALLLSLPQCKTGESRQPDASDLREVDDTADLPLAESLPRLVDDAPFVEAAVRLVRRAGVPDEQVEKVAKRIARYMAFLGVQPGTTKAKALMSRLMGGSTQFLVCDAPLDWACLEATPLVRPSSDHRRDASPEVGHPLDLEGTLDLDFYFTTQWGVSEQEAVPEKTLAVQLGDKIRNDGVDGIWMALYGIDDIKGWMKPVYDALVEKLDSRVPVLGVFDTEGVNAKEEELPLLYSLRASSSPRSIFAERGNGKYNIGFQYASSVELIKKMNRGISSNDVARARIEWPDDGIMHNKFMVMQNGQDLAVWTGTANVSETCMGSERNANMAVYLRNSAIAGVFKQEFEEMYAFRPEPIEDPELEAPSDAGVQIGHFHKHKTPNTRRYFRFEDGTGVHVHFAPTDDGEHRVIQPLLLNAKAGDEIRVSMFGGAGLELVRAFQVAVARGAKVRIILDAFTGSNIYSWIKSAEANLLMPNPYITSESSPEGSLEVRLDGWPGLNHHKTATFTRARPEGPRAEVIIIGSQNWSSAGNDKNDENMVTIVNDRTGVKAADAFNAHFDDRLWPASVVYDPNMAAASSVEAAAFEE